MTWAIPRACVRCGEPGPRIPWPGGYIHHNCLTDREKRERRILQSPPPPDLSLARAREETGSRS